LDSSLFRTAGEGIKNETKEIEYVLSPVRCLTSTNNRKRSFFLPSFRLYHRVDVDVVVVVGVVSMDKSRPSDQLYTINTETERRLLPG
jgi:hypothetical protein